MINLVIIKVKAVIIDGKDKVRAQFNTGANASVTNLFVYLHDYKLYDHKYKCPVKLTGAVGSNDTYPLGEGYLHIPAAASCGFIAVWCFYSPHFSSALVSPQDILKTSKHWNKSFSGQDMKSFFFKSGDPNSGHCTLTCHHKLRKS